VRISQCYHIISIFNLYTQTERRLGIPSAPNIVDFAVEIDNAIYSQMESERMGFSPDISFAPESSLDIEDEVPLHASLFENPEFESYGASYYTLEHSWTPADHTYKVLSPTPPLQVDGDIEDMYDGDTATCDRDSGGPSKDHPTCVAAPRAGQVVTAHSPKSSLYCSGTPAFSYPAPASIDEQDITQVTEVDEDCQRDSLSRPSSRPSFTRPYKRAASRFSAPRAKKRRLSTTPIPVSSTSAVRFPCRIPGCKQVCKTLGDLKRHESILAHKPPSWECRRCHYQFTREDALKRHSRNVPNCANMKANPRGRPASQRPDLAYEVEDV
jgi:hypothetical protein